MPDVGLRGLDEAWRALGTGHAAVLPHPSPQAYGIVATDPLTVNAAKGRPIRQDVGAALHDDGEWRRVVPALDLGPESLAEAHRLLRRDRVSLLLPLRETVPPPPWVAPAIRDGRLLAFGADLTVAGSGWSPLAELWAAFPRLFGSSANLTGRPPAATASEVRAMFGDGVAIVDGDALRDPGPSSATAILEMTTDGAVTTLREGARAAPDTARDGT